MKSNTIIYVKTYINVYKINEITNVKQFNIKKKQIKF